LPLMIEPLVFQPSRKAGGYMVDGDLDKILPLVRQAVELGADIIKADPTDDASVYHQVVEIAGRIPVLVRGGGKAPDQEILERTEALIKQGAAGIVYGRNIIQHGDPTGRTRFISAVRNTLVNTSMTTPVGLWYKAEVTNACQKPTAAPRQGTRITMPTQSATRVRVVKTFASQPNAAPSVERDNCQSAR